MRRDKIKFFAFPSVTNRPQFKADSILFPGNMMLSGKMTGAEKEAAIAFIKFMTGREMTTKMVLVGNIPGRKDMDLSSSSIEPLTRDLINYMGTIGRPGGDYSDYDTDLAVLEKSRFAIQGMLVQNTPETAAKAIQAEIDQFEKSKK